MAIAFPAQWKSAHHNFLASFGLFFLDPEDEREFFESYVYSVAWITQIFLGVGGLAFLKYVEQDALIDPDNYFTANNIRIYYSTPLIGLCVFSIFIDYFKNVHFLRDNKYIYNMILDINDYNLYLYLLSKTMLDCNDEDNILKNIEPFLKKENIMQSHKYLNFLIVESYSLQLSHIKYIKF